MELNLVNKGVFVTAIYTPCSSPLVRCALVASPVNKFAEIASPVPNYVSLTNK